jgi:DNA-directed RNA polymerase subunit RPC12/RpoP
VDDHIRISVSIPTDDDGYVRQECPNCGREFKAPVEDEELADIGHCPYCGHQDEQWFTAEQMEQFEAQAMAAFMPQVESEFKKMARDVNRSGGGFITMSVDVPDVDVPVLAPEAPDMCTVTSPCCKAKLKIDEGWSGGVFCPLCGEEYQV